MPLFPHLEELNQNFTYFCPKLKDNLMSVHKEVKRVTTHVLFEMKQNNEKISMLTGYDFSMARILDKAGVDVILVGDSCIQRNGWT